MNLVDALTAVEVGADALGFVFYEKSPRKIDPETARTISQQLPPNIERVGVFVNEPAETVLNTVARAGLTAVQLHGVESRRAEFIRDLSAGGELKIFLVLQANEIGRFDATESNKAGITAVFLDSGTPQLPGGTGKTFDWSGSAAGVEAIRKHVNIVVAGGLNKDNVSDAIRILRPWGVDVVSGVEARPGKKDPGKVREFIDAVRNAEKKT